MYDLIIIGAGPAGMTSAIYAARRKLKFLILGTNIGGQMSWSPEVDNYPGFPDISGINIVNKFKEHLNDYKIKVKQEEVIKLKKGKNYCLIKTKKGKTYKSKAVIIASGKKERKLNVEGEEKLTGKGINYCSVYNAPHYKNKKVAVIGGGNSGLESSIFLAKYAKKVYLLEIQPKLNGEPYLIDKAKTNRKISIITNAKTKKIIGKKSVEELIYEENNKEKKLKIKGIFVEVGFMTETNFTDVKKNKWKEIMIFRSTKSNDDFRSRRCNRYSGKTNYCSSWRWLQSSFSIL